MMQKGEHGPEPLPDDAGADPIPVEQPGSRVTLRRLHVFWAVAHFENLTAASKHLGITQPSLSQQLASFEEAAGKPLFERRSNRMNLTEPGSYVLRHVEAVLGAMHRLEGAMTEIAQGAHQTVHVAGINSVLRVLMPLASRQLHERHPSVNYNLHECGPTEVLELLYGRRINLGIISEASIAPASSGFLQVPIMEDPYVLAVPDTLCLDDVSDPARDLAPEAREVLERSIQFSFGTQHTKRVQAWYDSVIPGNWPFIQVRSFELALSMARAGLGVCLAPALSAATASGGLDGVCLYRVRYPPRRIVAILPTHCARRQPYADLIAALRDAAKTAILPELRDTPPFLRAEPED
jgi:DNA-binding transcriptional LysR family regulator